MMIGTENPKICILVNFVQKDRACRYHVNAMFQDSEPEVRISRRREPLRGPQADATICAPTAR